MSAAHEDDPYSTTSRSGARRASGHPAAWERTGTSSSARLVTRPTGPGAGAAGGGGLPPELDPRGGSRGAPGRTTPGRNAPGSAPGAPSRRGGPGGPGRPPGGPQGPGGPGRQGGTASQGKRILTVMAGAVALVILAATTATWQLVSKVDGIEKVDVFGGDQPSKDDNEAVNYLIVGSDDRTGISKETLRKLHAGGKPCQCTDTMMLVHISKKRDKATIVSLPRDSYVDVPAYKDKSGVEHGPSRHKLNAAYGLGGPQLTVKTIESITGLTIHHYLEVNFVTFVETVEALDGVQVCTPKRLKDSKSGLDLPAGTHTLDGAQSLAYVRARYVDPTADFGRMDRQQKFISSIIAKATSGDTLLNPVRLSKFVNAALGSVKTDPGLEPKDLVRLGTRLRNLSTSSVTFAQIPIADDDFSAPGYGSSVLWDEDKATDLFTAIKDDQQVNEPAKPAANAPKVTVAPAKVRVQVFNAAGVKGLGRKASDDLDEVGFTIVGAPKNADSTGASATEIRYDPRFDESVKTLQASLPGAKLVQVPGQGRTLQAYIGSGYSGAAKVAVAGAKPAPAAGGKIATKTAADNTCSKKPA